MPNGLGEVGGVSVVGEVGVVGVVGEVGVVGSHNYVLLTDGGEPECYKEALTHDQQDEWLKAMHEEMQSLHESHTYDLVNLPKGRRALKNKWVYRLKTEENNSKPTFKARLVVKGFSHKKEIDFEDIFSPVVKMSSIRVVLDLAASLNLEIEQLDILKKISTWSSQKDSKVKGKEDLFDSFMIEHRYWRTTSDHCVFVKIFHDGEFIILLLYVDDMLIVGQNSDKISKLKKELRKSFAMKDKTNPRKNQKLRLSQESYIEKVLKRFNMDKEKSVSTPFPNHFKLSSKQSLTCEKEKENIAMVPYSLAVGSLMYAMICTRPDITHAVGVVSRFLSKPCREHWNAVKWILRYLRGTSEMSLCFGGGKPALNGYTDADMAGDHDSRKTTSGYLITFSGGAVSWQSKIRVFHSRSKHIDVRYHWISDVLESKQLQLEKIHTDDNSSDMMTKSLPKEK
ncbi:hypothetical protein Prudu_016603 [Prunus dulcis]|uniref:Reverse transcriptase Ty1/copia-type domain-containing protein n=1 Tax=Prunus dulcis TaxID=3755 RepID=A0A4Y1RNJ8_PRUDU|nr:hypothetical protein Prudu_016603 [Prunus dulcis]